MTGRVEQARTTEADDGIAIRTSLLNRSSIVAARFSASAAGELASTCFDVVRMTDDGAVPTAARAVADDGKIPQNAMRNRSAGGR
jgi:hypothetical protein